MGDDDKHYPYYEEYYKEYMGIYNNKRTKY